jgi:hypothetical protein
MAETEVLGQQELVTSSQEKISIPLAIRSADNGKQCLPEPDPEWEPEGIEEAEADVDEEAEEKEVTFSERDKKDLPSLEKKITSGTRQTADAYRAIRRRHLWRMHKDDHGIQLFSTFDAYCENRHGHTRQWVTHLTNWLTITEELERLGIKEQLSVRAAQGLLPGRLKDAGGLRAVLDEAKEDGVPLDRDALRVIVLRRADYNYWSKEGKEGGSKPAAKTYAAYKRDLATVADLGDYKGDYDIISTAQKAEGDFADNLVAACQQEHVLPPSQKLLVHLTGKALEDVVGRLKEVAKENAEIEEKKKLLATRKKEVKAMLQEGGLKLLKDEAKALEDELKAKGVLKKKGSPPSTEKPNIRVVTEEDDADDTEADYSETDPSRVRELLAEAQEILAEIEATPMPDEDQAELNRVLLAAQECETKLAEIIARAKDCLPTTEEPEGLPDGND